jgi:hypothetical protein
MRKAILILSLFFLLSCGENIKVQRLSVEEGKKFEKLNFKKVWEINLWSGWCLAVPQGVVCSELLDRSWKESQLKLYDYSGKLKKERKLIHGDGPNETKAWNFDSVWLSSSGKIFSQDNNYLKTLDPETLEIETIAKLSNVIEGYGSKYTFGRHGFTSLEEKGNHTVTSFESSGFYEDMTYYIVTYNDGFENLSVIAATKKEKPWTRSYRKNRESYVDYYGALRLDRILSVDWKRGVVYYIPDIEKPEIESVDLGSKRKEKYLIDINFKKFKVEREEFESFYEHVLSATDPILKNFYKFILYIPPHAPALMGVKVTGDWLLIITGNRNWKKEENEVQVFSLPYLRYEGNFFIPFPNFYRFSTKLYDNYYIIRKHIKKDDDLYSSYEIYMVEEKQN